MLLSLALFLLVNAPISFGYETNGSTLIYNNSLAVGVRDLLSSSPFIFVNVPTTLRYIFVYNTTPLIMDTAQITILNDTYNLSYNIFEQEYQLQILFNDSEMGHYPFVVNGTLSGFQDASRAGTYRVVDYAIASFNIWDTINKSHRYDNKFANVIAIPQNLSEKEIYAEIASPLTHMENWMDFKLGIDNTKLYQSNYNLFYEEYNTEGVTQLIIPKDMDYTYYIVAGDHRFDQEFYGKMYYKNQDFQIFLTQDHLLNDTVYEVYVSSWDINFMGVLLTWLIWGTAIGLLFAVPLMVYNQTGNPEMLGKTILLTFTIVPALAIAVQFIVAWLM